MKKKVLISAQDYGAGISFVPIYDYLTRQDDVEVHCLVSGASRKIFSTNNEKVIHLMFSKNEKHSTENLLKITEKHLADINPDVILTGISGEGVGIDEAVLKLSKGIKKTYSYQDYWGHINFSLGVCADTIFVLDKLAYKYSKKIGISANLKIVGPPKYDFLDVNFKQNIFDEIQKVQKMPWGKSYVIFFGQPLWKIESYKKNLCLVIKAAEDNQDNFVYAPHPLEDKEDYSFLNETNITVLSKRKFSLEALILGSSKVLSCFSTVLFDAFLLRKTINSALPKLGALFLSDEIAAYHKKFSGGLPFFPLKNKGVTEIRNEKQLMGFFCDQEEKYCDGQKNYLCATEIIASEILKA